MEFLQKGKRIDDLTVDTKFETRTNAEGKKFNCLVFKFTKADMPSFEKLVFLNDQEIYIFKILGLIE